MFDYEVLSIDEAMQERYQLMRDGEYDAVIDRAEERMSASGNPMMQLDLTVYDAEGRPHQIKDYLVFTKAMMWKVIHCAESCGLMQEYTDKKFCAELLQDKTVRVIISTQEGGIIPEDKLKGKPIGSRYSDKNAVKDYIKQSEKAVKPMIDDFDDKDLPF